MTEIAVHNPIIFFDGVCVLCTWSVRFVMKNDEARQFRFCPLQSELAADIAQSVSTNNDYETVVCLYQDKVYTKSDVTFFILDRFGGWWRIWTIFKYIPKSIRDAIYDVIVKNRYRLFGKRESCYLPTPEERDLFL